MRTSGPDRRRLATRSGSPRRTEDGRAPAGRGATREGIARYATEERRCRAECMAVRVRRVTHHELPRACAGETHGCESALIRPFDRPLRQIRAGIILKSISRRDGDSELSLARIATAQPPIPSSPRSSSAHCRARSQQRQAAGIHPGQFAVVNRISLPSWLTAMVCPGEKRPSSSAVDSGLSKARWMARFNGRAPNNGS